MKNTFAFLLPALFVIALSSCGKDKNSNPSDNNRLTGTWNGEALYELEYKDGDLAYGDTTRLHSPDYFKLTFKAQHHFNMQTSISGTTLNESGTYTINGNKITLSGEALAESGIYTYELSSETLTLSSSETSQVNGHTIKDVERIVLTK